MSLLDPLLQPLGEKAAQAMFPPPPDSPLTNELAAAAAGLPLSQNVAAQQMALAQREHKLALAVAEVEAWQRRLREADYRGIQTKVTYLVVGALAGIVIVWLWRGHKS